MTYSPFTISRTLSALVIACAMAAFFTQPALAQTAKKLKCNGCVKSKQIKNGQVRNKDLGIDSVTGNKIANGAVGNDDLANNAVTSGKIADGAVSSADLDPTISLGTGGNDGDLGVKNTAGTETVSLDGATGNVTNLFANTAGSSNGLLKAWAKINSNGSIDSCWRCNTDPGETFRLGTGFYVVDFSPLATDIRARPRVVVLDSHATFAPAGNEITVDDSGDQSSVNVNTDNSSGASEDSAFTVLIY